MKSRSIINVKKIFGLLKLYQEFDRIIVTDDEIELYDFLSPEDILNTSKNLYAFHSVNNKYLERVISSPLRLLISEAEKELILTNFCNKNYYGWFSNLPVYESKYLPSFFDRYNLNYPLDFDKLVFEDFDFILYQYSLFLDDPSGARLIFYDWNLPDVGGSIWEMYYLKSDFSKFIRQDLLLNRILWCPHPNSKKIVPTSKMLFNTDRNYLTTKKRFVDILFKLKSFVYIKFKLKPKS